MKAFCFIVFIILQFSISCKTQAQQEPALSFLREIDTVYATLDIKGDRFDEYFKTVAGIAKAHPNYQPGKAKLDSLTFIFNDYIREYDAGLRTFASMKEFDTSFQIVKLNAEVMENFKNSWLSVVPSYLAVFNTGWENARDSDKVIISSVPAIVGKYQEIIDSLLNKLEIQTLQLAAQYKVKFSFRRH